MSTHPQFEAKQILDDGGIMVRICPATSNLPTRMSEAGWQALCKSTSRREQAAAGGFNYGKASGGSIRRRLHYCAVCKGKIRPKGLEIIPAAELAALKQQHREDVTMAKVGGKCTACGRSAGALSSCHGEKLCPSCSAVYSAINNRPQVVLAGLRKLKPETLLDLAGAPAVQVSVESEALKRIAEAVGYDGEDGEVLVARIAALAAPVCKTPFDDDGCTEGRDEQIADLQAEVERLEKRIEWLGDFTWTPATTRALGIQDLADSHMAVLQTAAMLEEAERQLDSARMHGLRKNDTMREQYEALAAINHALGLPEHTEAELIISNIGSMMQAVERLRQLAIDSDHKADRLQVECNRLENQLANQNEAVAQYIDPAREVLADFAMRVLRGEAELVFGGR